MRRYMMQDAEAKKISRYKISPSRLHIELLVDLVEQQTDVDFCQSIE